MTVLIDYSNVRYNSNDFYDSESHSEISQLETPIETNIQTDFQLPEAKDTGSGWDIGFEDDELSAGASAAAAAAPLLPGAPALRSSLLGRCSRRS